jgi:hypothetical protein
VIFDNEIYGFLNWVTKNAEKFNDEPKFSRKRICSKITNWDSAFFDMPIGVYEEYLAIDSITKIEKKVKDTLFKKSDRDFFVIQFASIKESNWKKKFAKSKMISCKKQKRPNRYYYSIPLFSVDRSLVIVKKVYYCGDQCAHGGYDIYRRVRGNKWEFITTWESWIS